jgi:hypothetical protein
VEIIDNIEELEVICYEKILEYYQMQKEKDREEINLWKHRTIVKIMEIWNKTKSLTLVRNSLILIISLFGNIPPDPLFNNRGININLLSKDDRQILVDQLKGEFLGN